jgi:hypothetical protein
MTVKRNIVQNRGRNYTKNKTCNAKTTEPSSLTIITKHNESKEIAIIVRPSNSRTTVLCNPFLSNGTVNTSTIIGVFREVCAECL